MKSQTLEVLNVYTKVVEVRIETAAGLCMNLLPVNISSYYKDKEHKLNIL